MSLVKLFSCFTLSAQEISEHLIGTNLEHASQATGAGPIEKVRRQKRYGA
jgi:hypothetical protein